MRGYLKWIIKHQENRECNQCPYNKTNKKCLKETHMKTEVQHPNYCPSNSCDNRCHHIPRGDKAIEHVAGDADNRTINQCIHWSKGIADKKRKGSITFRRYMRYHFTISD